MGRSNPEKAAPASVNINKLMDALDTRTFTREEQYDLIHKTAIECAKAAAEHNNFDMANRLMLILENKLHKPVFDQLVAWFTANGPFAWKETEDKTFANNMKFRKARGKNVPQFDLQAAQDNPWYQSGEEIGVRFRKTRTEAAPDFDGKSVIDDPYRRGDDE